MEYISWNSWRKGLTRCIEYRFGLQISGEIGFYPNTKDNLTSIILSYSFVSGCSLKCFHTCSPVYFSQFHDLSTHRQFGMFNEHQDTRAIPPSLSLAA